MESVSERLGEASNLWKSANTIKLVESSEYDQTLHGMRRGGQSGDILAHFSPHADHLSTILQHVVFRYLWW